MIICARWRTRMACRSTECGGWLKGLASGKILVCLSVAAKSGGRLRGDRGKFPAYVSAGRQPRGGDIWDQHAVQA